MYVETEWDPADPVGETGGFTGSPLGKASPGAVVAQARLDRDDVEDVLARQAAYPSGPGHPSQARAAPSPDAVVPGATGVDG